uniref:Ovule protein n=1 Tax=Brugia timori TaxID=42155 RepID=A0A0R3RBD1_9BILA
LLIPVRKILDTLNSSAPSMIPVKYIILEHVQERKPESTPFHHSIQCHELFSKNLVREHASNLL